MKKIVSKIAIPIIAAFVVLAGCNNKQHVMEKPDNLIILADSYLIESTLQMTPQDSIGKDELARRYYKDLFDRYHITNEQFASSIAYYVSEEKSAEKLLSDASALIVSKKTELLASEMED